AACPVAKPYDPFTEEPDEGSADIVFDAVGMGATRAAASKLAVPGGTIVHIGLQDGAEGLDTRRITLQEISFSGTYCYSRYDFGAALALLTRDLIENRDWIETRPLDQGAQSFHDIHDGKAPPKIILTM
ncbi:MAG: zinc-binding dehydrogenase, partial [Pseudomonadota bacterium]